MIYFLSFQLGYQRLTRHDYVGHYIVLVGYDPSLDVFL